MLALATRQVLYAEQLNFQWSTKFLLQVGRLPTINFTGDVLGVSAIPTLLARNADDTQDSHTLHITDATHWNSNHFVNFPSRWRTYARI